MPSPPQNTEMTITVFHCKDAIVLNGGFSIFHGPNISYMIEDDRGLHIRFWETSTETGDAYFAPGSWGAIITSWRRKDA